MLVGLKEAALLKPSASGSPSWQLMPNRLGIQCFLNTGARLTLSPSPLKTQTECLLAGELLNLRPWPQPPAQWSKDPMVSGTLTGSVDLPTSPNSIVLMSAIGLVSTMEVAPTKPTRNGWTRIQDRTVRLGRRG